MYGTAGSQSGNGKPVSENLASAVTPPGSSTSDLSEAGSVKMFSVYFKNSPAFELISFYAVGCASWIETNLKSNYTLSSKVGEIENVLVKQILLWHLCKREDGRVLAVDYFALVIKSVNCF